MRTSSKVASPTASIHRFAEASNAQIQRSRFDRSHGLKTTFDAGQVVPIYLDEALPGDTFSLSTTALIRMATPIFPIMDNVFLDFHFFLVPMRLLWEHWEPFNGAQANPNDSIDFVIPQVTAPVGGWTEGSLGDYLGLPIGVNITTSSLPFRCYNLIWNAWYRDENLQNSVPENINDGPDVATDYVILPRGKRKDYFTGALPWAQKFDPVTIPLGTSAPIQTTATVGSSQSLTIQDSTNAWATIHPFNGNSNIVLNAYATGQTGELYADLSEATSATINALRQAFQIQRIGERDARGGTRYVELLRAHFGVISPDARLQRPEYLGGGTIPIMVSPVPQTVPAGGVFPTPQGNLAAFAVGHAQGIGFHKSIVEHCYVMGFVSARADLTYQQGVNRLWLRKTRFDFYLPALAHLGEQTIYNAEIYAQGTSADSQAFGYQEAFAEYRYKPSAITGLFRSTASGSLDAWHLAQDFGALPTLSATFVQESPPMARIEALPNQPDFLLDCFIRLQCARPMPVYSVPGYIDHF